MKHWSTQTIHAHSTAQSPKFDQTIITFSRIKHDSMHCIFCIVEKQSRGRRVYDIYLKNTDVDANLFAKWNYAKRLYIKWRYVKRGRPPFRLTFTMIDVAGAINQIFQSSSSRWTLVGFCYGGAFGAGLAISWLTWGQLLVLLPVDPISNSRRFDSQMSSCLPMVDYASSLSSSYLKCRFI